GALLKNPERHRTTFRGGLSVRIACVPGDDQLGGRVVENVLDFADRGHCIHGDDAEPGSMQSVIYDCEFGNCRSYQDHTVQGFKPCLADGATDTAARRSQLTKRPIVACPGPQCGTRRFGTGYAPDEGRNIDYRSNLSSTGDRKSVV